eukprot:scaffold1951_cov258-Pinguiococcus_pyrenoidosus.AAC.14
MAAQRALILASLVAGATGFGVLPSLKGSQLRSAVGPLADDAAGGASEPQYYQGECRSAREAAETRAG